MTTTDKNACFVCPRNCGADRRSTSGFCNKTRETEISGARPHYWEEPCISGKNGSGTIFFTGCNLGCVFCQNYAISHSGAIGQIADETFLIKTALLLKEKGVNNINFVTPSHYTEQLIPILPKLKDEVGLPIIWNSSAYEKAETIKKLEGLIDIYLPDLKFYSPEVSSRYCNADDYFTVAISAIAEMLRQQPINIIGSDGLMTSGVIIRHMVLPSHTIDSIKLLKAVKEKFGNEVMLSIMCQYIPEGKAADYPEINRRLKRKEYSRVTETALTLGFESTYIQDFASADESFIPEFSIIQK